VAPDDDGHVSFENGRVRSASRTWHIPKEATTFEVLEMVSDILMRLTGDQVTCGKITTHRQHDAAFKTTTIILPKKLLVIETQRLGERRPIRIEEALRMNPVPDFYEVQDPERWGKRRCVLVE
jgi:hypothetical protein